MGIIRNKTAVITMETSPCPKKARFKQMSKSMLTTLFDPNGVVDHKFMISYYTAVLQCLWKMSWETAK
jgi:hypothetical protein